MSATNSDGFERCKWCNSLTDSAGCLNLTCARLSPLIPTTPTPPDAVREALVRMLMWAHSRERVVLAEALGLPEPVEGEGFTERLADALLTRPSDARGREAVANDDGWCPKCGYGGSAMHHDPTGDCWRICAKCGADWDAPLSPTQEGA